MCTLLITNLIKHRRRLRVAIRFVPLPFVASFAFRRWLLICPQGGVALADNVRLCSNCGAVTPSQQLSGMPLAAPSPPFVGPRQTSGKAIGSLICGVISILPLFIVAVILGHFALSDIKKSAGRLTGQGLAIAGLVLGYLGVVAIPFILYRGRHRRFPTCSAPGSRLMRAPQWDPYEPSLLPSLSTAR
jgi:Domain of unknown function (DUF4190)